MYEDESRFLSILGLRAGGAVGFVADDEIEIRLMGLLGVESLLRLYDLGKRLVCGEDDPETSVRLRHQIEFLELAYDRLHVRRSGKGKIRHRKAAVIVRLLLAGNLRIRANAHRTDGGCGIGGPFVERLPQKRNGWHKEKNKSRWFHFRLRYFK